MIRVIGFIESPIGQRMLACIYTLIVAFVSIITQNIHALFLSIFIVCFLMIGDFFTGIYASRKVKNIGIESSKARWSPAKYVVYSLFVAGTLILGILIHMLSCFNDGVDIYTKTSILKYTLSFIQGQMIFVSWIEAVSIVENLRRVYPDDPYLKGFHYILVVDFRKMIPHFSKYLKDEKSKEIDNPNNK